MGETKPKLAVPVIDISALVALKDDEEVQAKANDPSSPEGAALHKLVDEVRAAATEWGFFYISNHGVSEKEIEELRAWVDKFFALPKDIKNQIRRTPDNSRGYYDNELTKNKRDWKEVFDFAGPLEDLPEEENGYKRLEGDVSRWLPEETLPGFRAYMRSYYDRARNIARRLLILFSLALGKEATYLDQFFTRHNGEPDSSGVIRLNYYPISPDPENTQGVYDHKDADVLTVLLQDDTVATLQVFHRGAQEWVYVPPIKGTYVINVGDLLQVWSNDRFPAPNHRVLSSGTSDRVSVPFFYFPGLTAAVEPILVDKDEKPLYRTLTWYDYFQKKVQGNFYDLGEEIQIHHYRI